jgi:hypothetical protein
LERTFHKGSYAFDNKETGSGLRERDIRSIKEAAEKHCKYYFDLEKVLGECSSTCPITMTDKHLNSDHDSPNNSTTDHVQVMVSRRKKDGDGGVGDGEFDETARDDNYVDNNHNDNTTTDEFVTPKATIKRTPTATISTITKSTKKRRWR